MYNIILQCYWNTFWNFTALPEDDKIHPGIIGGVVAAAVAVAIVIGVAFLIRRRRNG